VSTLIGLQLARARRPTCVSPSNRRTTSSFEKLGSLRSTGRHRSRISRALSSRSRSSFDGLEHRRKAGTASAAVDNHSGIVPLEIKGVPLGYWNSGESWHLWIVLDRMAESKVGLLIKLPKDIRPKESFHARVRRVATTALARVCHQDEAIAVGKLRLGSPDDVTARAEVFARDDDGELPRGPRSAGLWDRRGACTILERQRLGSC
jgi:hypothetical protein